MVAEAAKAGTDPGRLELSPGEREAYATDVADARDAIRAVTGTTFDVPGTIEVQNRHHWIDANVETFRRLLAPIDTEPGFAAGVARTANTGAMAFSLSFLASNVLGQYDPLLLADGEDADHALYFVHPNVRQVSASLDLDYPRFRRWVAFHEVTHAAEFGTAPWLSDYLEERVEEIVETLAAGRLERDTFGELDAAMTAVEGYAELLMDRAFDEDTADLRAKLTARRRGGGPVQRLVRRLLGLGLKRRQYERGRAFFEAVADAHGISTAARVWEHPDNLPTSEEFDHPGRWVARID